MQSHIKYARISAAGAVVQSIESLLPLPFPGIKPGFANVFTLVSLIRFGKRDAFYIGLLRVIAGAIIIGTIFTPSFLMSLAGFLVSFPVSVFMLWLSRFNLGYGLVTISVMSAIFHNIGQLFVAGIIIIRGPEIFQLAPLLMLSSCFGGLLTGIFSHLVLSDLKNGKYNYIKKDNNDDNLFLSQKKLPKVITILSLIILLVIMCFFIIVKSAFLLAGGALIISFLLLVINFKSFFKTLKGISFLLSIFFILSILFYQYGTVIFSTGKILITKEGIFRGILIVSRLAGLTFSGRLYLSVIPVASLFDLFGKKNSVFISDLFIVLNSAYFFRNEIKENLKKRKISLIKFVSDLFRD